MNTQFIKKFLLTVLSFLTCLSISSCSPFVTHDIFQNQAVNTINIFTWDGMFPEDVLDGFEKETGIRVKISTFDLNETMLTKLEKTDGFNYDIVIADDYIVDTAIKNGLAQKLDKESISTYDNINPLYQSHLFDPKNEYTIPYGSGIPLIVYNPNKIDFIIDSYDDLWNSRLEDNIAIIGNYRVINGITLASMGESMNCQDAKKIKQAGDKLQKLSPNIKIISDDNTQDFLISEEVDVAFLYTSQVNKAIMSNKNFKVVFPKETLGFGIMSAFIPSHAPKVKEAHTFLEYINKPEIAASCYEHIGYYCTNKAAEPYIDPNMKDLLIAPDFVTKGEVISTISKDADKSQLENWNKFLSENNNN